MASAMSFRSSLVRASAALNSSFVTLAADREADIHQLFAHLSEAGTASTLRPDPRAVELRAVEGREVDSPSGQKSTP